MESEPERPESTEEDWKQFQAEAAFGESIFLQMMGDMEGCVEALRTSLQLRPDWPQAILAVASVEYQLGNVERGAELIARLLELPDTDGHLWEFADKAGEVLIEEERYAEGLEYYEAAVERFPGHAGLLQGVSCCAGHVGLLGRAVDTAREALRLEPDNQKAVNDLGFCLFEVGELEEAERLLARAAEMDPGDDLARNNLEACREAMGKSPGQR